MPDVNLESRRHFKALAVLIVGLTALQTAWLDYRTVRPAELAAVQDSILAIQVQAISYQAARTRTHIRAEVSALDNAITSTLLPPIDSLRADFARIDSTHRATTQQSLRYRYRLHRAEQILSDTTLLRYYLEDRIFF